MKTSRDPDTIVASWLDEGPTAIPDETRRSIAIAARTSPQARSRADLLARRIDMTRFQTLGLVAAVAIVAVVGLVALSALGGGRADVGGQAATASPAPSDPLTPALTEAFTSETYGFSIRYPADWSARPATGFFSPSEWAAQGGPVKWLDILAPPGERRGMLRAVSVLVPEGAKADDLVATYMDCAASCQATLTDISIGGQPARLQERVRAGQEEVQASVLVGDRVYVFTLSEGANDTEWPVLENVRGLFDALMATVEFHPEDALAAPSSSPSP
jgi:hypothetical protein